MELLGCLGQGLSRSPTSVQTETNIEILSETGDIEILSETGDIEILSETGDIEILSD